MTIEIWKPVLGFSQYEVSNLGRIRNKYTGRIRAANKGKHGYWQLGLNRNRRQEVVTVHIVVLEAFKGKRPPGLQGMHGNNNDRDNNSIDNLEWGTPRSNLTEIQLRTGMRPNSKLTEDQVRRLRKPLKHGDLTKLAKEFGIHEVTARYVHRRIHYKHVKDLE